MESPEKRVTELREMGHILDTPAVREAESKYGCSLEGYTAAWSLSGNNLRVYVKEQGRWRGVYILSANDVEIY